MQEVNKSDSKKKPGQLNILIIVGVLLLVCCGLFFAIFSLGLILPSDNDAKVQPTSTVNNIDEQAQNSAPTTPTAVPTLDIGNLGEITNPYPKNKVVVAGDIVWKVKSAKSFGSTIPAKGTFYDPCISESGKFVSVTFSVTNNSKDSITLSDVTIVDDKEREYRDYSDLFTCLGDFGVFLEPINPGLAKTFTAYFEVAKNSKNVMLKVGDLSFLQDYKYMLVGI